MDIEQIMPYVPRIIFIVIALGLFYEMRKYVRKNDVAAWLRDAYARTARAAGDEEFRKSELADAEAQIAKYPVPNPIAPITNKQQIRLTLFPKLMFMITAMAVVFLYFGLFETLRAGVKWPVFAGWAALAIMLFLYFLVEKTRPYCSRVQQINRKYLLQKAGKDAGRFDTLREVLEYYPKLPELWMELGDQYAVEGRMDDAVAAMEKARECAPKNMDLAVMLASFELRKNNAAAAAKALEDARELKTAITDPRVEIYSAALALLNNEKKKAEKLGRQAFELDEKFTAQLLEKDEGLKDLAVLLQSVRNEKKKEEEAETANADEMKTESDSGTVK